jgi:hypothetical protein
MLEAIKQLIESRNQLAVQAREQYAPLVQQLIAANSRDKHLIEHTLDGLLDFCFDDQMLLLYRRLCRHLYDFDPEAAVFYVEEYREMWDEEGKVFGNNKKKVS